MNFINTKKVSKNKFLAISDDPQILIELPKASPYLYISADLSLTEGASETLLYHSLDGSFTEEQKLSLSCEDLKKGTLYRIPVPARFFDLILKIFQENLNLKTLL